MSQLIKPVGYEALLDMKQTEQGIKLIKEFFQQNLKSLSRWLCHSNLEPTISPMIAPNISVPPLTLT